VLQIQHVAVLGVVVLADDAADGERVGAAVGVGGVAAWAAIAAVILERGRRRARVQRPLGQGRVGAARGEHDDTDDGEQNPQQQAHTHPPCER